MAIDMTSIQTFSDQDILNVLRMALVNTAFAKDYSIGGRQVSHMSGSEIQALIQTYEWRVARAANGMFYVAQMRTPE